MRRSKGYDSTISAYYSTQLTSYTVDGTANSSSLRQLVRQVSRESFALELEEGVFRWQDPKRIAQSLK